MKKEKERKRNNGQENESCATNGLWQDIIKSVTPFHTKIKFFANTCNFGRCVQKRILYLTLFFNLNATWDLQEQFIMGLSGLYLSHTSRIFPN